MQGLRSEEARARFIELPYVEAHPALFLQLDRHWVCKQCQKEVDKEEMPPLAAKNGLAATWASLPRYMKSLTDTELQMVALTKVRSSISGYQLYVLYSKFNI